MIRDILYLIVYFITETVLYSLAYRTVLSRGITNKAVKWMVYIIAVVITGSIVYVNNNLQYVMGASIFIMVMLPVFIIEPFEIQNLILYPFVVIASSIFGILFSFIISIKIGISQYYVKESPALTILCQILSIGVWALIYVIKRRKNDQEEVVLDLKHYIILYLVTISSLILVGSIQIFSELEEYEDLQIYGVFAVMACCTLVVVTLMQIVVLSQNAYIKKSNDMYKEHMALQKQHYEHMLLQYEELRKFRHDVKNHMLALNSMCTSEDNSQIKKYFIFSQSNPHIFLFFLLYLSQLTNEVSSKKPVEYTGNRELDAVIAPFVLEAESKNIKVQFKGRVSDNVAIDMFDMCTIISNLLNNAIEACEKIQEDKRIIEFEIAGYNSQIFISVSNSYDMESIINQKQKFITTKEDKLNHGIGLENVSGTVKKYDGDMRISQENERFIVTINI